MDMIGRVLAGRYEILEKIGEGGMAIVYKAKCNLLNRYVAIKILKAEYAKDDNFVKKFKAEAQSAASLTHPNIVSVYDVGQEDGGNINYIVMELLETKTLKDYIEEKGAMSSDLTLKIAAQIASALEVAHKSHIIHRDIKPHNIVLNKNMVAKVTDFGIAKINNTTTATITSLGTTVGSVHYFSPEHAKGGYTDERSDIYSLGIVMYEMATGKLPFEADSPVSVALKQVQEEAIPPIVIEPKISVALNQIILKAMEKSTARRYQNATEVLADISKALANPNNKLILKTSNSVEAGVTQVIPTISSEDEFMVPNIRTRQARKMSVIHSSKLEEYEDEDKIEVEIKDVESSRSNKNTLSKDETLKKNKKKKIIIISAIIAVICIGIFVFAGVKLNEKRKAEEEANKQITVPNVVGRVYTEVVEEYKAQGIEVIQDKTEYSAEQPEGSIISQTPEKGATTKDKKIYVVVSKGEKLVEVTDVVGKDSKVAKYELEDTLGFKVETTEVISTKVAVGLVVSQSVAKGEKIATGSTIKLEISKGDGKATVLMPSVLGKTESEAKKELEDLKLTVNVKTGEESSKSNGVVIAQNYPQNQQLKEGALVEITINKLLITKTISLDLLELQGGTKLTEDTMVVKATASIDGGATNTVFEKTIKTSEKTATFDINGYKTANLKIYLNGAVKKEQTINF